LSQGGFYFSRPSFFHTSGQQQDDQAGAFDMYLKNIFFDLGMKTLNDAVSFLRSNAVNFVSDKAVHYGYTKFTI